MQSIRGISVCVAICLGTIAVDHASARDCSVSKEFHLRKAQAIAGTLEDPYDATLSGIELELLSGKKAVRHTRTDNQGTYDFGTVPAGKYRIRVQIPGDPFCAPKVQCQDDACSVQRSVKLNPRLKPVIVE